MDLLTQVQSEQHISHELGHRLGHQEEELNEIRHQVSWYDSFVWLKSPFVGDPKGTHGIMGVPK